MKYRGIPVADNPALLSRWDFERNGDVDPALVGSKNSKVRRWWRCPVADDHRWLAPTAAMTNSALKGFTGCPACAGRQVSVTNSLATRFPEIARQWHPTKNGDVTPESIPAGTQAYAWWVCDKGPDHEWRAMVSSRTKAGVGCPACAGKRASVTNSVASIPWLAAQWHTTNNLPLAPDDVVATTAKKLWWRCEQGHEWRATGVNRATHRRGCPYCQRMLRSMLETALIFELRDFFPDIDIDDDKIAIGEAVRHVDILIRSLSLVIEIDGRYRHMDSDESDRRKTEALQAAGWRVVRLRESPLLPISQHDVLLPLDPNVKQTADLLLQHLRALGWAEPAGLDAYLQERAPRHLSEALAVVTQARDGRVVRIPGRPKGPNRPQRWERAYAALVQFAACEGHARVKGDFVDGDLQLGSWVTTQRTRWKAEQLDPERIARLEAVSGWIWSAMEAQWWDGYAHLLNFIAREGHSWVPAHHVEAGFPLGSWTRSHRRRGGRKTITAEQQALLDAIPDWSQAKRTGGSRANLGRPGHGLIQTTIDGF